LEDIHNNMLRRFVISQWLTNIIAKVESYERRALLLAFGCNFSLMGGYYILRPVRDAMAAVFGVDRLQELFTGTLVLTLLVSPVFAWLTDKFKLSRVLPGVFLFLIINIVGFCIWFHSTPDSRWLAATFYWWFSVFNLFIVSVFWSVMVDVFTSTQSTRLFPMITAGGSLGAIAGPLVTRLFVHGLGVIGLLLTAGASFVVVIAFVRWLIREKGQLQATQQETQVSVMNRQLSGNALDGFKTLFTSSFLINHAAFILLMTWVATVGYFIQTELISKAFADIASRTQAIADIDLVVNISSALVATFGLSRFIKRFGVTGSLVLNPILVAISFVLMAMSPTLLMLQAMQAWRRITQYAIARPSREICFTVVDQESRYKAKNIIDVAVYRFGDLSSAWLLSGLRMLGFGMTGALSMGVVWAAMWGVSAWSLGHQYEKRRAAPLTPKTL
jgi:ATP:ADP antiporter, AAA family